MSKERMNDLLSALQDDGWAVQNFNDRFCVENEKVSWMLVNLSKNLEVIVDFHLFDNLGRRTECLKDNMYGVIRGWPALVELYQEK